jgi:hypothetical protein
MLDLSIQHSEKILKKHIYEIHLMEILRTQKITAKFAVNYLLNEKYQLLNDEKITIKDVLHFQPHITIQMLISDHDSDSGIDFEHF